MCRSFQQAMQVAGRSRQVQADLSQDSRQGAGHKRSHSSTLRRNHNNARSRSRGHNLSHNSVRSRNNSKGHNSSNSNVRSQCRNNALNRHLMKKRREAAENADKNRFYQRMPPLPGAFFGYEYTLFDGESFCY